MSNAGLDQARSQKIKVAEDKHESAVPQAPSPVKAPLASAKPEALSTPPIPIPPTDSGYHGSVTAEAMDLDEFGEGPELSTQPNTQPGVETTDFAVPQDSRPQPQEPSSAATIEETFQSAGEEQTRTTSVRAEAASAPSPAPSPISSPPLARAPSPIASPLRSRSPKKDIPAASSPSKQSQPKQMHASPQKEFQQPMEELNDAMDIHDDDDDDDEMRSPSEGSSPIRPVVRKSSLNFASLPAREPLQSNKPRMSRISHLDQTRTSYYNRQTGGKSLGGVIRQDAVDDQDEMNIDAEPAVEKEDAASNIAAHSKTYTQRLQDQISMLGKAQPTGHRASKSIANILPPHQSMSTSYSQPTQVQIASEAKQLASPRPKPMQTMSAPGAFPEDDDEDDWIAPPKAAPAAPSPRPELPKSHTADVMENIAGEETVSGAQFGLPKSRPASPAKAPVIPERTTSTPSHTKSASVPYLPTADPLASDGDDVALKKTTSVSNPPLPTVSEDSNVAMTPKTPSRVFRDSPLKHVKNKLSSILKNSKTLLASSAAISAEGKSSLLSPSATWLGQHPAPSTESFRTAENVLYPDLTQHDAAPPPPVSPTRNNGTRRTRASTEREKKEAKEKEKEAKEAKRHAEQMDKLEKLREKEAEKARVFSKEQEKLAAMEKRIAAQKEQEKIAQAQAAQTSAHAPTREFKTPGPALRNPALNSPQKTTRASPQKTREPADGESKAAGHAPIEDDFDMADAPATMPPPSVPRSAMAPGTRQAIKRPVMKPLKEPLAKPKHIRVATTSSQHSQFHPSNSALGANLHETLPQQPSAQRQTINKPTYPTLQSKPSMGSLKSSVSSASGATGRLKALDMAAKRKEQVSLSLGRFRGSAVTNVTQEERDAQRKREAKLEIERKREDERRLEVERQKEEDRKQKKAAIEKAKQTKAPPPAARPQPNGLPEYNTTDKAPARPVSRLAESRPANPNAGKAPAKRTLQPDTTKEVKRMRMSEEFDQDIDMADTQPNIKGPPIRPSAGLKKVGEIDCPHLPAQHTNPHM